MPKGPPTRSRFLWILIGDRVRVAREGMGLGPAAFAVTVGISRQALCQIESGRGGARLETLYRIARAIKKPLADLLPDIETCDRVSIQAHNSDLADYIHDELWISRG